MALCRRETCEACCCSVQPGENLNPVVASLIYTAAGKILEAGGAPRLQSHQARQFAE